MALNIESSDIQELFESQDEDLTETDLEEMLNPHSIEEEPSTSTENASLNRKTWFFMKIYISIERSLIFKSKIVNAAVVYQFELKALLKAAKQEKITKFF